MYKREKITDFTAKYIVQCNFTSRGQQRSIVDNYPQTRCQHQWRQLQAELNIEKQLHVSKNYHQEQENFIRSTQENINKEKITGLFAWVFITIALTINYSRHQYMKKWNLYTLKSTEKIDNLEYIIVLFICLE